MKRYLSKLSRILPQLRWMAGYSHRYRWVVFWHILLGLLGTAMGLAASVVGKNIIDAVTGQQTGAIVTIALWYVSLQLVEILLSAVTSYINERMRIKVSQQLRGEVFDSIIHARWQEISQYHSGDLLARASRDSGTVAGSVISWIPSLIINLFQFFGSFFLIFYYDYTLALLALASAPVVICLSGIVGRRMHSHSSEMRQIGADLTAFHGETFSNMQLIKSFGLLDVYGRKLRQLQNRQKTVSLKFKKFSVLTSSAMSLVGMVVSGLCFFWSVYRLWKGHITFGEMTMFLQLAGVLSGAFRALVGMIPVTISAATAAERVMEVFSLPKEEFLHDAQVQQMLQCGHCRVKLDQVEFSYTPELPVLKNVSMEANPGQIIGIVGASGEGKTTLLRILLGIVDVSGGAVTVDAEDLCIPVSPSTRKLFSYVPQDNTLFSGTIEENLRIMAPDASEEAIWEALEIACAADFVRELGLDSVLGERGNGLSQGQIQRLSIARALLSPAPILLLDEATSALDVDTESRILKNIVSGRKNRTCMITTHRLSVLDACQQVYEIANGEIRRKA